MIRKKIIILTALTAATLTSHAVFDIQFDFETFNEATDASYGAISSENIGNAYLGQFVAIADAKINAIEFGDPGNTGLGLISNNNKATRAAFLVLDGSSIAAGAGSVTFDIINNFGTTTLRVGVWEVDNGSGTAGNSNIYDTGSPAGTSFSDTADLGVFGQGDASSSFLGTELSVVGSSPNDVVGTGYAYAFDYTGGDLVVGFSVEGNGGTDFNRRVIIDNLQVTVVPEPATYALLGGLLALGFVLRRRRK